MSDPIFQAVVESNRRLTETVEGKVGEIDQSVAAAQKTFDDFIKNADSKFQSLIKGSGKFYGSHDIMYVCPPVYVDPALESYKEGQYNGILLWRIGEGNDDKRIGSIGLQGDVILTRYGYESFQKGELRALRQYSSYYSFIESGLNVALETMTVDGIEYRVLTSNMSGGGTVILDGLLSFRGYGVSGDSGSIRDENFGRYVNTKDGSVYNHYAPIASLPYDDGL
ncbi:hypothetical protein [Vibrio owensii]|uniref:Uncharacterized protein n=1 Tax=Vibrio owensii CAIM 1854 = LMG 25443 TaxID=1229493 RepID=A0A0C1W3H7_9VIBR|nr:hypothetical protein [Vibrio owensii]KIF50962.1 hypothetical protein H735_21905 [Vibrio owensii CAIM 1854 = LMG 25443]